MELGCMTIHDNCEMYSNMIIIVCDIGKSPAYKKRRALKQTLHQLSNENTPPMIANIMALDSSQGSKNIDEGFVFLT
jgi:hypothetical protein